ncbi:hypothetical protein D3C81_1120020 [compost metagenome]
MARQPSNTDFELPVEGVGTFRFARRTMRDEISIQVEYARIIQGVDPTAWLATIAGWLSTLKVLTVLAPEDWDIEAMDPLDEDTYATLLKVHAALADKERSFRKGKGQVSETQREGALADH